MKRTILWMVVCLGALAGIPPAVAQKLETVEASLPLNVNLPFAASVGGVTLPAGDYTIRDVTDRGDMSVLQISSANGTAVNVMAFQAVTKHGEPAASEVVLKEDEGGYKIDSVWLEGHDLGYRFVSPK